MLYMKVKQISDANKLIKKEKKNGKFPSKNKASPIDFETQISLRT